MTSWAYLSLEHPIRFAHRGSRLLWPENTMTAFQGAVDLGYRYLETDVRMTSDGVVAVIHDATLERTTNGAGPVAEWRWDDLRRLDAGWSFSPEQGHPHRGTGITVPSLDELLQTFPDVHVNIDLKASGIERAVADVVATANAEDRVLIGSFVDRRIANFRRASGGRVATSAGTAAAMTMWVASRVRRTVRSEVAAYQVPYDSRTLRLDGRFVAAAQRIGAHVHAWTVNDADDMHRLLDLGVDGIVTDRPDTLNEVLEARGRHD